MNNVIENSDNKEIISISTEELFNCIDNNQIQIIDIRSVDAYNGWKKRGETRGGHIKNARSLPHKWLHYLDWIEIVRSKGIYPEHKIIIYGYDIDKIRQVAERFSGSEYDDVSIYTHFLDEWSTNDSYPMEKLERFKHLISADWLHRLINTDEAPTFTNKKYLICHAHYQNKNDYDQGHIPQAVDLDTNLLESPETWNRRSPEELKETLEKLGITFDTTVILYGRFSYPDNNDPFPGSSAGHLGAIRCALIMLYAGVEDIRILNGGLQSWIDEGYEINTKYYPKNPVKDFGRKIPAHPEIIIDLKEAKEFLQEENHNLVSVRSWDEYIGKVSGYHYIEQKGRIPGAVFGNCGSDAYHMENYRNLDHTMREAQEVKKIWAERGIIANKFNVFYCGTGWRASEAFFNAWLMGWPHVAIFDGGWFEWTNNGNRFDTGNPEKFEKELQME